MVSLKEKMATEAKAANSAKSQASSKKLENLKNRTLRGRGSIKFGSKLAADLSKDYTKDTVLAKYIEDLGAGWGRKAWDDVNVYRDSKGYEACVFIEDISRKPYDIRIQDPQGNLYIINSTSIDGQTSDLTGKSYETDHIIELLSAQLGAGASIAELTENLAQFKKTSYPPEIERHVKEQTDINEQIKKQFESLHKKGSYGIFMVGEKYNGFDPYQQKNYPGAPNLSITQSNRDTSGNIQADITESYAAVLQYADVSTDVAEIHMECMREWEMGKGYTSEYAQVMDIETLMKKGYDRENAQRKLNKVAQQLLSGKSIKEVFVENRQFLTEKSAEKLNKDMKKQQQKSEKPKAIKKNDEVMNYAFNRKIIRRY